MNSHPTRCPNTRGAHYAQTAFDAYCKASLSDANQEGLTDLIADLGHLAELLHLNFLDLVKAALTHWEAEHRHPDGLEVVSAASVTVTIQSPK